MTRAALLLAVLSQQQAPSALEELAERLVAETRAAGAEAPMGVVLSAPGHPALEDAFWTVLSARLKDAGLGPVQLSDAGGDAEVDARARGLRTLLRLSLMLLPEGTLQAGGPVFRMNVFSGRAGHPRLPLALVMADERMDAGLRALAGLPETAVLWLVPQPLAQYAGRTAALATGDMDGDGRPEVAVLTEEAVDVRAVDGRLLARRSLEGLPRAPLPPREAFGTLAVCDGLLYAYSAGRAAGEVLALVDGALVLKAPLLRPVVACGTPPREASFLPGAARLVPVGKGWPEVPPEVAHGPAAWGLLGDAGRGLPLLFLLEDGTARVPGSWRPIGDVGAGAALVDAVGKGHLGLAASGAAPAPTEDVLRLLALEDGKEGARVAVPGRILQAAALAAGAGRPDAVVLGVWRPDGGAELRLVRSGR